MNTPGNHGEEQAIEELLRRRGQEARPAGGPACGDAELLAAYAEGSLAGLVRGDFEQHLAVCGACREAVARLVRLAPRESVASATRPALAGWARWAWAAPVLAGVALVGSLAWYGRERIQQPQPVRTVQSPKVQPPLPAATENRAQPSGAQPAAKDEHAFLRTRRATSAGAATHPAAERPDSSSEGFAPAPPVAQKKLEAKEEGAREPRALADTAPAPSAPKAEPAVLGGRPERDKAAAADEITTAPASKAVPREAGQYQLRMARPLPQNARQAAGAATPATGAVAQAENTAAPDASLAAAAGSAKRGTMKFAAAKAPAKGRILQMGTAGVDLWALMADGRLFRSSDEGRTWRRVPAPERPRSFLFEDEKSGEIVARSGARYSTTDGGQTWTATKTKKAE